MPSPCSIARHEPQLIAALLAVASLLPCPARSAGATGPHAAPDPAAPPAAPPSEPSPPGVNIVETPTIVPDYIPMPPARLREMARYAARHYAEPTWALAPTAIVLHYTVSGYASARRTFAADGVHRGERPGVCAHYAVDMDGTIYALVPPAVRCRHTIGLNHRALGVEFVQPRGRSSAWMARQILARPAQRAAGRRLVSWLQARFHIATGDVIGHAMANGSPQFRDLRGWRNDHGDWTSAQVAALLGGHDAR